jgi:hypothetical protein
MANTHPVHQYRRHLRPALKFSPRYYRVVRLSLDGLFSRVYLLGVSFACHNVSLFNENSCQVLSLEKNMMGRPKLTIGGEVFCPRFLQEKLGFGHVESKVHISHEVAGN